MKCKYCWYIVQNKYENPMMLTWNLCGNDLFNIGSYCFILTKIYFTVFPCMQNPAYPHACNWYCHDPQWPQMAVVACKRSINSLAPGKFEWNFRHVIFTDLVIDSWCISCEIALIWMSLDFTDDQSTLVQVLAWCRQATSHYLNQCWPRSVSPHGVTRPQWVNWMSGMILLKFWKHGRITFVQDDPAQPWLNDNQIQSNIYIFDRDKITPSWFSLPERIPYIHCQKKSDGSEMPTFPKWPSSQHYCHYLFINKFLRKHFFCLFLDVIRLPAW